MVKVGVVIRAALALHGGVLPVRIVILECCMGQYQFSTRCWYIIVRF